MLYTKRAENLCKSVAGESTVVEVGDIRSAKAADLAGKDPYTEWIAQSTEPSS